MTCPSCGGKTKVFDTRADEDSVWRRRECKECGIRFSTMEIDLDLYNKMYKTSAPFIYKKVREATEQFKNDLYNIFKAEET